VISGRERTALNKTLSITYEVTCSNTAIQGHMTGALCKRGTVSSWLLACILITILMCSINLGAAGPGQTCDDTFYLPQSPPALHCHRAFNPSLWMVSLLKDAGKHCMTEEYLEKILCGPSQLDIYCAAGNRPQ